MITLITGGIKSGKSNFALSLVEKSRDNKNLYFLATAQPLDPEMTERIERHKTNRKDYWKTIEEPEDLTGAIESIPVGSTVLIDCVTLWLINILGKMELDSMGFEEIKNRMEKTIAAVKEKQLNAIFITNEVGSGIIPENKLARLYGDIIGKINQLISSKADEVYWMVSGVDVKIKPGYCDNRA
ncbi:MAG: bifunctional adenosylcobinamide kinase/adenosylcobinamide-phosphate guanylyltransferase [Elusimicrobiota bacterium]